jgi:hypothetical protein
VPVTFGHSDEVSINAVTVTPLTVDDDLTPLFAGPIHWFADWPHRMVPRVGSLVYTIWRRDGAFLYVGMAGRSGSRSPDSKGPYGRLEAHASGKRSGNQFCIYVCDRLVLPRLGNRLSEIGDGKLLLDDETRSYIRAELGFRWQTSQSPTHAWALEDAIKCGQVGPAGKPILNGK